MIKAMLNLGKFIILSFFLLSCNNEQVKVDVVFKSISEDLIGRDNYEKVYFQMCDSLKSWSFNGLGYYKYCGVSKNCFIDSLICFNKMGNRLISCLLKQQLLEGGVADDIDFFYGEKINNKWYFFSGPNIFVPREMFKGHNMHTPLSYQQLHEVALKEVYGGYLLPNGKINELWFKGHFEGIGWGDFKNQGPQNDWYLKGRRFKTEKEFYEAIHLDNVRNNWYGVNKDSIKQLPKKDSLNL